MKNFFALPPSNGKTAKVNVHRLLCVTEDSAEHWLSVLRFVLQPANEESNSNNLPPNGTNLHLNA